MIVIILNLYINTCCIILNVILLMVSTSKNYRLRSLPV